MSKRCPGASYRQACRTAGFCKEGHRHGCATHQENKGLTMNLALNYGGRNEIVDAVRAIAAKIANDRLSIEQIGEKVISDHLYTAGQPDLIS